ncbi:MAG: ferredoxin [Desulfobacteraceae bacterium]|nr:ferredoxin [Desulfobacteraceae bacterium]
MTHKISDNTKGRFYVDTNCINCSICCEIAPGIFATNHEQGYEYVLRQPDNKKELAWMAEAMDVCPARAIQDNG